MTAQYKVMCGCECCISTKIMHLTLLTWRDLHLKHLKYISNNEQNRRSGELLSRLFETYKNYVIPHGCLIYNSAAGMAMSDICPCPYHTGNVYFTVARNAPILLYLNRRQIKTQQKHVQQ